MDDIDAATDNSEQPEAQEPDVLNADQITIKLLTLDTQRCPFEDWYRSIKDTLTRQRIRARIRRLATGNLGDFKPVGSEVFEIRLDFGPGYRIYFAKIGDTVIVLLAGGDKSTQQKDIDRAIELWRQHKSDAERFQRSFPG